MIPSLPFSLSPSSLPELPVDDRRHPFLDRRSSSNPLRSNPRWRSSTLTPRLKRRVRTNPKMLREKKRASVLDAQEARIAELERQIRNVKLRLAFVTQQKNNEKVAFMHRFQADGRRIRESRARIAELEEQVIETTEDRDRFHQRTIDLEEQVTRLTGERDEARQRVALLEGQLAVVTRQRNQAVEVLLEVEDQGDLFHLQYHDLVHAYHTPLEEHHQLHHHHQQEGHAREDEALVSGLDSEGLPIELEEDVQSDADSHAPPP